MTPTKTTTPEAVTTPLGEVLISEAFEDIAYYAIAVNELRDAAGAYYNTDDVLMDDATYDALARRIAVTEALYPTWAEGSSFLTQVGAGVAEGGDVAHTAAMLSLDNVFTDAELTAFLEKVEKLVGHKVAAWRVEPKLDGLALSARYENGTLTSLVKRGDGKTGEDVMHIAPQIAGLPLKLSSPETLEIRGEVMMTDADYATANEIRATHGEPPLKNPRNGAAGTVNAKHREYTLPISFFAYTLLEDASERRNQHEAMAFVASLGVATQSIAKLCTTSKEVIAVKDGFLKDRATLGIGIDGAVIKVDDVATREEAGNSTRSPRWAIAFKYPADTRETDLLAIEVGVGRTGNLSFTASLSPVDVGGVTVTSASVSNASVILAKGLRLPDYTSKNPGLQKVWVRRAGDVIPEITGPSSAETEGTLPFIPPTHCPNCGGEIDTTGLIWRCRKGRACNIEAVLTYAVARDCLDIDALGPSIIKGLVEAGLITSVTDLFDLTVANLLSIDRVGEILAKKIVANIDAARALPMNRVFCALGVTMTGRSMSRKLASHFGTMTALTSASLDELQQVEAVGPGRAEVIRAEIELLNDEFNYLAAHNIGQVEPKGNVAEGGVLSGTTWVVTGTMVGALAGKSRNEVHALLESLGAKVSSSVSKSTSTLLVGENAGSKSTKAAGLGVAVMTEAEFAATYSL